MESAGTKYLELALSRQRPWVRIGRTALLVVIVVAPIVSAMIGYRSGYLDGIADTYVPAQTVFRMWTDQEVKSLGGDGTLVSVSCTYHEADGTIRISDHPMPIRAAMSYRC